MGRTAAEGPMRPTSSGAPSSPASASATPMASASHRLWTALPALCFDRPAPAARATAAVVP